MAMVLGSERIPESVKRRLIEKMFDIVLLIGAYMLGLEIIILQGSLCGKINSVLLTVFTIVGTIGLIIVTLMAYRQYYIKEIKPIKEHNRALDSA